MRHSEVRTRERERLWGFASQRSEATPSSVNVREAWRSITGTQTGLILQGSMIEATSISMKYTQSDRAIVRVWDFRVIRGHQG